LNTKEDLLQKAMKMKLELFCHIDRMNNSRKIKSVVMGKMDGNNKRRRPYRKWLDDIKEWCQKDIHLLIENSPRTKQMEIDGKMFVGHLRAFGPWICLYSTV